VAAFDDPAFELARRLLAHVELEAIELAVDAGTMFGSR
jgi:uncharacterized ferritin-like protein (DUF455 family)